MERIWLESYPEGVPADINLTAYASTGWPRRRGLRRSGGACHRFSLPSPKAE
jgi:hypothetical protein